MTVSSGIAMEIHYCMGKRAGIDFYKTENDKCSRCGMKENKTGCCHDEHKFKKLEDSHKNVFNTISFDAPEVALLSDHPVYNWKITTGLTTQVIHNNSPPIYSGISACIMNCVFRI